MQPDPHALLRTLRDCLRAGDVAGCQQVEDRLGSELAAPRTLVLALGIGGAPLVRHLATLGAQQAGDSAPHRAILESCRNCAPNAESPQAPSKDDTARLLRAILTAFSPHHSADEILRQVKNTRAAPPVAAGAATPPRPDLSAIRAELEAGGWEAALERCRALLHSGGAPEEMREVYALASSCLHRLRRFTEAEQMARLGLGPLATRIALPPAPPPEETILARWRGAREPVVSILCTTYNHERYIAQTLHGFLAQETGFPFEIRIHDDASTDGTAAVIRCWQERYPSIIHATLQTENQYSRGVRPFDLLLAQCRGRYIATCEGDDYWIQPRKLQSQVDFLEQHPDYSCAATNYYLFRERHLSVHYGTKPGSGPDWSREDLMTLAHGVLWVPTLIFRRLFTTFPSERQFAPFSDQFLTSYLGTFGRCRYEAENYATVRRENEYSIWTPMVETRKEELRVRTWLAIALFHHRHGRTAVAAQLFRRKIAPSPLDAAAKRKLAAVSPELDALWDACAPGAAPPVAAAA